jgi:hypothetical protein
MASASGEDKEVPDCVAIAHSLVRGVKDNAAGIAQPAGQEPPDAGRPTWVIIGRIASTETHPMPMYSAVDSHGRPTPRRLLSKTPAMAITQTEISSDVTTRPRNAPNANGV